MRDLIIVGSGPAGYTAGIYAGRYLLDSVILTERKAGTLMESPLVENYPGFKSLTGFELGLKIEEHLNEYEVPVFEEKVLEVRKEDGFVVKTDKKEYSSRAVIIATGWERRKLPVPGVEKFEHKGISYCATCDAPLYADKTVCVVGGGDAGIGAALMVSEYADKVYVVEMLDKLAAEPIKQKRVEENDRISVLTGSQVERVEGEDWVERIVLSSGEELSVQGLFVEIGGVPNVSMVDGLGVNLDERGSIVVDNACETSVPGVFAAGDVTDVPFKQAVVAAGQGAIACWSAYSFLEG